MDGKCLDLSGSSSSMRRTTLSPRTLVASASASDSQVPGHTDFVRSMRRNSDPGPPAKPTCLLPLSRTLATLVVMPDSPQRTCKDESADGDSGFTRALAKIVNRLADTYLGSAYEDKSTPTISYIRSLLSATLGIAAVVAYFAIKQLPMADGPTSSGESESSSTNSNVTGQPVLGTVAFLSRLDILYAGSSSLLIGASIVYCGALGFVVASTIRNGSPIRSYVAGLLLSALPIAIAERAFVQ